MIALEPAVWGAVGTIAAAIIGGATAVIVAVLNLRNEVKTNNGKRAWEYIEMIGDLKEDMGEIKADLKAQGRQLRAQSAQIARLERWQEAHQRQDAENFELLQKGQEALWNVVVEEEELLRGPTPPPS